MVVEDEDEDSFDTEWKSDRVLLITPKAENVDKKDKNSKPFYTVIFFCGMTETCKMYLKYYEELERAKSRIPFEKKYDFGPLGTKRF